MQWKIQDPKTFLCPLLSNGYPRQYPTTVNYKLFGPQLICHSANSFGVILASSSKENKSQFSKHTKW